MNEQNSGKKEIMLTGKMSIKTKLLLLAILPALLVTVILLLIAQKSMNEGMVLIDIFPVNIISFFPLFCSFIVLLLLL